MGAKGPPVLLLHGWPYDVHTYAEIAPRLGSAGYRVIVPYLRGYGPTLFRSIDTIRNGQQSALGLDAIALMDALDIRHAIIGGFDWGARAANVMAAITSPSSSTTIAGGSAWRRVRRSTTSSSGSWPWLP